MLRVPIVGALLLGAAALLPVPATAQRSVPLRVQRAEIMDPHGFEKPLVAYTMFVPATWRAEGGVEYPPANGCNPPSRLNWRASDPGGVGAIQLVGEEKWAAGNFPMPELERAGCLMSQVSGIRPYLEWWVKRNRPGARIMDFRPRADLTRNLAGLNQENPELGLRSWVEGGEVLIAYQLNGKPVRESISSTAFFTHTRSPQIGNAPPIEMLQGTSMPGFAVRMPEGALDFKMVEALRHSIQAAPEWSARTRQAADERHRVAMESGRLAGQTALREQAKRGEIMNQTRQEINDIQMGTWQSKNESMDRQQRERIESIRGVETYNDPHYGGTVQLSNQYQHAWQLRDGSYVLTDDVNFDPGRALGVEGQRLKPVQ